MEKDELKEMRIWDKIEKICKRPKYENYQEADLFCYYLQQVVIVNYLNKVIVNPYLFLSQS